VALAAAGFGDSAQYPKNPKSVFDAFWKTKAFGLVHQGNRVKNSCGYEACEEVVVPGGDFAFET